MKNYIILFAVLFVGLKSYSQNTKITGNQATFISELKSLMSTDNRTESQQAFSTFAKGWEEGKIGQADKDAIVQIAVLMDELKLRANDFVSKSRIICVLLSEICAHFHPCLPSIPSN